MVYLTSKECIIDNLFLIDKCQRWFNKFANVDLDLSGNIYLKWVAAEFFSSLS